MPRTVTASLIAGLVGLATAFATGIPGYLAARLNLKATEQKAASDERVARLNVKAAEINLKANERKAASDERIAQWQLNSARAPRCARTRGTNHAARRGGAGWRFTARRRARPRTPRTP